jgi:hypothetical protein
MLKRRIYRGAPTAALLTLVAVVEFFAIYAFA